MRLRLRGPERAESLADRKTGDRIPATLRDPVLGNTRQKQLPLRGLAVVANKLALHLVWSHD